MVYPEYLAFWIILLPFVFQNVLTQKGSTEIYETMVLFNGTDSALDLNETEVSILPSSSFVQYTTTTTTGAAETTIIDFTVYPTSGINKTIFEVEYRLPTDDGLESTPSAIPSALFPSILSPYCSQPFECISNSFFFDIATTFLGRTNTNGTLYCFQSINSCNKFCSQYYGGECYHFSSSLAAIGSSFFFNSNTNNCGEVHVVCLISYFWILAITMILTTIAILSAIIAAYKFIKSRRSPTVTLISFRYTGNFPDLQDIYNHGEQIDPQQQQHPYDTVHFDHENGNVTIFSTKN